MKWKKSERAEGRNTTGRLKETDEGSLNQNSTGAQLPPSEAGLSHHHSATVAHLVSGTRGRYLLGTNGAKLASENSQINPKTWCFAHPAITSKWSWPETVRKAGTLKKWFFSADFCVSFDVCKSKTHKLDSRCLSKDPSSQLTPFFLLRNGIRVNLNTPEMEPNTVLSCPNTFPISAQTTNSLENQFRQSTLKQK